MSLYDISVRTLIGFLLRSGDLMPGRGGDSVERALLGSRIHRTLQKQFTAQNPGYITEYPVKYSVATEETEFRISGRADGLLKRDGCLQIDEIKSTERQLPSITEPEPLHIAQAKCYGAILTGPGADYAGMDTVEIRIIYCNTETEQTKSLTQTWAVSDLQTFFSELVAEYSRWVDRHARRLRARNEELTALQFPFAAYREGQREVAVSVYRTIDSGGKLFVNAPTGIGKTVSVLFPALKALGEGKCGKIFYLTARNAGALPPTDALNAISRDASALSYIILTGKEKICPYQCECLPERCDRAAGHYDRINAALEELTERGCVSRELISACAERHCVCPFELALDYSYFADVVVGDYNYVYDPKVRLARYFDEENVREDYVFLTDEAHNLPDRARTMYTAEIRKSAFLEASKAIRPLSRKVADTAGAVNRYLLEQRKLLEDEEEGELCRFMQDDPVLPLLENFCNACKRFLEEVRNGTQEIPDAFWDAFFSANFYLRISEIFDRNFCFVREKIKDDVRFVLFCADPSGVLDAVCKMAKASVFFSGTLEPLSHYIGMIGGDRNDTVVSVPSPFPAENRLMLAAYDVETVYRKRHAYYALAASYVRRLTELPTGNYMVFFSSYKYLQEVAAHLPPGMLEDTVFIQPATKNPDIRERFLSGFVEHPKKTRIGLCVLGGIFSEGIDLTGSRLSGVIIVGVGLPMVCRENEIIRTVIDRKEEGEGFRCAYVFPGINKVLQAAGRVIRTAEDRGFVVLLDERYRRYEYETLLAEAYDVERAGDIDTVFQKIRAFLFA